jgi:hypothetical protein
MRVCTPGVGYSAEIPFSYGISPQVNMRKRIIKNSIQSWKKTPMCGGILRCTPAFPTPLDTRIRLPRNAGKSGYCEPPSSKEYSFFSTLLVDHPLARATRALCLNILPGQLPPRGVTLITADILFVHDIKAQSAFRPVSLADENLVHAFQVVLSPPSVARIRWNLPVGQ